jgi:hypothetical protein
MQATRRLNVVTARGISRDVVILIPELVSPPRHRLTAESAAVDS